MFVPSESQEITPPVDAQHFALDRLDEERREWVAYEPPAWGRRYRPAAEWPESDDVAEWATWALDRVEPGVYRARWTLDDRRKVVGVEPVIVVAPTDDGTVVAVGSLRGDPIEAAGSVSKARASKFGVAPLATSSPPEPEHKKETVSIASVQPVHNPQIDPSLVNEPLQIFTLVYSLVSQQTHQQILAIQEMTRAVLSASVDAERARTTAALATQRSSLSAAPIDLGEVVREAIQPIVSRLDQLEGDAEPEPDLDAALRQLATAAQDRPKSALEQIAEFMSSPAGAVVAQLLSRSMNLDPSSPPSYTPPTGNAT